MKGLNSVSFTGLLLFLFAFVLIFRPGNTYGCDTSPVLSASNVTNVGGGNYTVDFQVCIGINGSIDGFDLQIGCGLSINSVTPTTLTGAGGNATASIAGNTVTFDCASCNSGNWWEPNDFISGPCFNFTANVNGDPANCPFTVTGINDGCLIIQSSWSGTVPGPCVSDFGISGPTSHSSSTSGQGNNCNLRSSLDRQYEINLPCNDTWTFSLCGGASWDTYLYLGTSCCTGNLALNDDFCGLQSQVSTTTGPGTVYLTVEAFSSGSGSYTLNITGLNGCPLDITDQITLTAVPGANKASIDVQWLVRAEANVLSYHLERSLDGEQFDRLTELSPTGIRPDGTSGYAWTDYAIKQTQTYFYRVQVHTTSGELIATDPVAINLSSQGSLVAGDFYPNPGTGEVRLLVASAREGTVLARIFDARGVQVDARQVQVHSGLAETRLDVSRLRPGMYFVKYNDPEQGSFVRRVVVE